MGSFKGNRNLRINSFKLNVPRTKIVSDLLPRFLVDCEHFSWCGWRQPKVRTLVEVYGVVGRNSPGKLAGKTRK